MEQVFLSDIELYFTPKIIDDTKVCIEGDECRHILQVMRHKTGDEIFVTNGNGRIFRTSILETSKKEVIASIEQTYQYENKLANFTICIPRIKNQDRFEFAIEKCIELGFTNFVIFDAVRTVAKGEKLDRWNKIAVSAMKQSLRSFIPKIEFMKTFKSFNDREGVKIIFDQNSETLLIDYSFNSEIKYNLIFGPEGGLTDEEKKIILNKEMLKLTENRLRAETAVVAACSAIALKF